MPAHSARSLFDLNVQSSDDLLKLYDGIERLDTKLNISWLLRATVVFSIAALDAYFHDKVKYRAGRFDLQDMPPELAKFKIPLGDLSLWEAAERKGNVLRNWVTEHFSPRPLQRQEDIAKALSMVGMQDVWATIEPNSPKRDMLLGQMRQFVQRRNQIAHEGDRESSRKSGKKLRAIDRPYVKSCVDFVKDLIARVEKAFPR